MSVENKLKILVYILCFKFVTQAQYPQILTKTIGMPLNERNYFKAFAAKSQM